MQGQVFYMAHKEDLLRTAAKWRVISENLRRDLTVRGPLPRFTLELHPRFSACRGSSPFPLRRNWHASLSGTRYHCKASFSCEIFKLHVFVCALSKPPTAFGHPVRCPRSSRFALCAAPPCACARACVGSGDPFEPFKQLCELGGRRGVSGLRGMRWRRGTRPCWTSRPLRRPQALRTSGSPWTTARCSPATPASLVRPLRSAWTRALSLCCFAFTPDRASELRPFVCMRARASLPLSHSLSNSLSPPPSLSPCVRACAHACPGKNKIACPGGGQRSWRE